MKTVIALGLILFSSCQDSSIKVYKHSFKDSAFVRKQDNEIVPYAQADGWYAVTPSTMEYILNRLDQCQVKDIPTPIEEEDIEEYLALEVGHETH